MDSVQIISQAFNEDLNAYCPGVEVFLKEADSRNYYIFREGPHPLNINIVGWRNKKARADYYDDFIAVYWEHDQKWNVESWKVTTLPGVPWLLNPMSIKGTAVLKPGQYLNSYELGKYKGYAALKQVKAVTVYRDRNRNSKVDFNNEDTEKGLFGVHIHKGDFLGTFVKQNSAGCQVFKNRGDFDDFIVLCDRASKYWGKYFTYTLMEF